MLEQIKEYDNLLIKLNGTIRTLKIHPKVFDKEEHKYLHPVYEKSMYIALSAHDLLVGMKYLEVSAQIDNQHEANYFARALAHTVYELINNQQHFIGEEIFKIVNSKIGKEELADIKLCTREFRDITKNHHKMLKTIRNKLFGHRTPNGAEMANRMIEIDNQEIYVIGKEVFNILIKLLPLYTDLIKKL